MNEIAQFVEIAEQRHAFLEDLLKQWTAFEGQLVRDKSFKPGKEGEMAWNIESAMKSIKEAHKNLPRLQNDLKSSLDVVSLP